MWFRFGAVDPGPAWHRHCRRRRLKEDPHLRRLRGCLHQVGVLCYDTSDVYICARVSFVLHLRFVVLSDALCLLFTYFGGGGIFWVLS